jgi:predicted DNA-binding mobile mystery protein A
MGPDQALLARKNLDKRLVRWREEPLPMPRNGWVKAIREALGLSAQQLASRMGVVQSRLSKIEKAEVTGSTTIKTLRETAEAMGCEFVYAIVPRTSLSEIVKAQAEQRAEVELARIHHTMCLENQAVDESVIQETKEILVQKFLSGPHFRLWDAT